MKAAKILAAMAVVSAAAVTVSTTSADARGRGFSVRIGGGFHAHRIHRAHIYRPARFAVVYPSIASSCVWVRRPWGLVKRCYY